MTPEDIIRQTKESLSEWLEMSEDPANLLAGALANKILKLQSYIEYLEKRIKHDCIR